MSKEKWVYVYEGFRFTVMLDEEANIVVYPQIKGKNGGIRISFKNKPEPGGVLPSPYSITIEPLGVADLCDRDRSLHLREIDVVLRD